MKKPELLAPAGDIEAFYAAVNAGADAVYLGVEDFSARKRAKNFSFEDLKKALEIAKNRNIKVYITINTLIKEEEIPKVIDYINKLVELKVDGLIIQDLGLLDILLKNKKILEDNNVTLQLSTQASVYGNEGRDYFENLGLDRVVIARESNLEDYITDQEENNIETKVFCHGALCYAYSGQCNFSSTIGQRSGNRGECAQPCRKFYTLSKNNKPIKQGFLLSTKELNTLDKVENFNNSNIDSIKIEGRMRSPEYVYAVTDAYRKKLDGKEANSENIEAVFSRDFTDGLIFGNKHNLAQENSKKRGVLIGRVGKRNSQYLELKLNKGVQLINGDGISFGNDEKEGTYINRLFDKNKKVVPVGENTVYIKYGTDIKKDTPIYRSFDKNKIDTLRKEALKTPELNKEPIDFDITLKKDQNPYIRVSSGDYQINFEADFIPEIAQKIPLKKEDIEAKFSKLGNSNFYLDSISIDLDDGLFLTKKQLNVLRNESIEKLNSLLKASDVLETSKLVVNKPNTQSKHSSSKILSVRFEDLPNYEDIKNLDVDEIILKVKDFSNLEALRDLLVNLKKENKRIELGTNTVLNKRDIEEIKNSSFIELLNSTLVDALLVSNFEILSLLEDVDIELEADKNLNIFNTYATQFLKDNDFSSYIISDELNKGEIRKIAKKAPIATSQNIYGKRNLMISSNCVLDCKECKRNCSNQGWYNLENQRNDKFLLRIEDQKNFIYDAKPLYIPSAYTEQEDIDKFIINVLDEDISSIKTIIEDIKTNNYNKKDENLGRYLNGVK